MLFPTGLKKQHGKCALYKVFWRAAEVTKRQSIYQVKRQIRAKVSRVFSKNTWGFNLVPWVMPPVMAQQCKFYQSVRGLQSTNVPYLSKDLGFVFTSASPMCKTFPSVKRMNTSIFPQIYILEVTWEITLLSYSMNFSLKTFHAAVTKDSWRLLLNWAMNSLVSFLKTLTQKKSKAFCLNKILPLLTVTNSTTNSPVSDQNKYELSSLMPHFSSPLPFCMFHRAALWASTTNVLY